MVDDAFRRIDILRHRLVGAQSAPSEAHHLARKREYRIYHPRTETVAYAATFVTYDQPRLLKKLVGISRTESLRAQSVAAVERISQMEALYHALIDAALTEIGQSDIATLLCLLYVALKPTHGEVVDRKHTLPLRGLVTLLVGQLTLLDRYAIFSGENSQRSGIVHLLHLHDEAHRRTTLAATETFAEIARFRHRKRRRALVVERTQPYIAASALLKAHIIAHHLHYVGGVVDLSYCSVVDPCHGTAKLRNLSVSARMTDEIGQKQHRRQKQRHRETQQYAVDTH